MRVDSHEATAVRRCAVTLANSPRHSPQPPGYPSISQLAATSIDIISHDNGMNGLTYTVAAAAGLAVLGLGIFAADSNNNSTEGPWPMAGHDVANSRRQPDENRINKSNVSSLTAKWTFRVGETFRRPRRWGTMLSFLADWARNLYAVRKDNGQQIWTARITQYDGAPNAYARVSPARHGPDLIIGDIASPPTAAQVHEGARVMAVNRQTGALHWATQVEKNSAAIITGSPVVVGDVVMVGVSSNEENLAGQPEYVRCTFRGSMVALDANTGKMLWQTYTAPDNGGKTGGYRGGAIWQPPAVDSAQG
jgi:polyvinyl alcohol dehydrogenase (cytochrome)